MRSAERDIEIPNVSDADVVFPLPGVDSTGKRMRDMLKPADESDAKTRNGFRLRRRVIVSRADDPLKLAVVDDYNPVSQALQLIEVV